MKLFKKEKNESKTYYYTDEEMEQYQNFIIEHYGNFENIIHEIVSPDIHVDIIVVPPTKDKNYYKLFTMGMGAYKMNVPKRFKNYKFERAELAIFLPPDWKIDSNKEEDYWPIRQLKVLARLPLQTNSWLGHTHTVSMDENNSPYADNTKFCSMLLIGLTDDNNQAVYMNYGKNDIINIYALCPLYEEELLYVQQAGVRNLPLDFDWFIPINIKRKNTAKIIKNESNE